MTEFPSLEPLEVSSGMVFGRRRSVAARPDDTAEPPAPRAVLEELLRPALERGSCRVAFSGGRDSSALLALAVGVARDHGLDDPIPVTLRFARHPRTHETDWQEQTIRHLRLDEWEILSLTDELEALGPIATSAVRRHGFYWPPNAHTIVPLLNSGRGGSLLMGTGGDEVFSPWIWKRAPLSQIVQAGPRRAIKHLVITSLPRRVQLRFWSRRALGLHWLQPAARQQVQRLYLARHRPRSDASSVRVENLRETRNFELTQAIFSAFARERDVDLVQPFFDPRFLRSIARTAPARGFSNRIVAMRILFGDLLPPPVVERVTKAKFTDVLWGARGRAFAERWDGTGVDPELVDTDALRQEWLKPRLDYRSLSPLQSAWRATTA